MITLYSKRGGRRTLLMVNGAIRAFGSSPEDVSIEAEDAVSGVVYVMHLTRADLDRTVAAAYPTPLPEPAPAPLPEPAPAEEDRTAEEPADRSTLPAEGEDVPAGYGDTPAIAFARWSTANRKAKEWGESDGRPYKVYWYPLARGGRGGYAATPTDIPTPDGARKLV